VVKVATQIEPRERAAQAEVCVSPRRETMAIRTRHQARVEAIRGWGREGFGEPDAWETVRGGKVVARSVGLYDALGGLPMRTLRGTGPTWEAAFAAYDKAERRRALFDEWKDQPCPSCFRTMRVRGMAGPMASPHWPCVVEGEGAMRVLCLRCKDRLVLHALMAWAVTLRDRQEAVS
jgi:hypothetical protein